MAEGNQVGSINIHAEKIIGHYAAFKRFCAFLMRISIRVYLVLCSDWLVSRDKVCKTWSHTLRGLRKRLESALSQLPENLKKATEEIRGTPPY